MPQIVRVGNRIFGTEIQRIRCGDVLLIYKVEKKKKILARDIRGKEFFIPSTCNWKLDLIEKSSEHVYGKICDVPSRLVCVVEDLPSFDIAAGDLLLFSTEPFRESKARFLRCRRLNSRDRLHIKCPANLKGKFQALQIKGSAFSNEQVLKQFPLPVTGHIVFPEEKTANCSEKVVSALESKGMVQIEREIDEETVFTIPICGDNCILTFSVSLEIFVAQCTNRETFLSLNAEEYFGLMNAIKTDQALQDKISVDQVYFTSKTARCFRMNALRVPFFRFEQKESTAVLIERGTTTQQHPKLRGEHPLRSTQKKTSRVTGQPSLQNSSINDAPVTPPKEVKGEEKYKMTSDHKKESEKYSKFLEGRSKQEAIDSKQADGPKLAQFFKGEEYGAENETNRSLKLQGRQTWVKGRVHFVGDISSARHARFDKQGKLANKSRFSLLGKETFGHFPPSQHTTSHGSYVSKRKDSKTVGYSIGKYPMDSKNNGIHPLKEPLTLKEDNSPEDKLAEVNHDKENDHAKLPVRQSLTGNIERDRTRNLKDVNFRPKQKDNSPNEFAKDGMGGKINTRKGLFRSLSLKSRRFRQEPASSVEKRENLGVITERNRGAKTVPINVPLRKAVSWDNLSCLLSSPKDDDFEHIKNITKFLEVQEKLKKALARIAYLENQRSEPTDEEAMMTQDIAKSAPATQDQELRFVRENNERRTERNVKIQRNVQLNQVLSFKERSEKSFSLKKGGRASSTSRLLDGPEFTPLLDKDSGDSTDDGVFINEAERRLKIKHNPQVSTTSGDDCDEGYVFMSSPSIGGHPPKTIPPVSCLTARNDITAAKEGEDHSCDVDIKRALRKNILEVPWTEEEWTELTELVRYEMNQRKKRQMVSYTNWPLNGRQTNLLAEQSDSHSSSHQEDNRRKAMVFSENLNQQAAANEQLLQGQQRLINDPQRLVRRSVGRRPVPTPRRRASLQASATPSLAQNKISENVDMTSSEDEDYYEETTGWLETSPPEEFTTRKIKQKEDEDFASS